MAKTILRKLVKVIEENPEVMDGLRTIYKNKPNEKMLIKASEELNELSTAILQIVTKVMHNKRGRTKVRTKMIADEYCDVLLNLLILGDFLGEDLLLKSLDKKTQKFLGHKDLKRYGKAKQG